jgi:hypothetical protein
MDWKLLIAQGETRNVELKGKIGFDSTTRVKLIKSIAAMANTRDGGRLFIGVERGPAGHHEPVGLDPSQLKSFDQTKVSEVVYKYFRPRVSLRIEERVEDGKRLACIAVEEFDSEPVIAIKSGQSGDEMEFREGSLLIRTAASESRECRHEELRDLLIRAAARHPQDLLRQFQALIEGRAVRPSAKWQEVFATEIAKFLEEEQGVWRGSKSAGVWSFSVFPGTRLAIEHKMLKEAVDESRVSLSGIPFPTRGQARVSNKADGVWCSESFRGSDFIERWQAFKSGAFFLAKSLAEDTIRFGGRDLTGRLAFPSSIDRVAEFVLFAQRYLKALGYSGPAVVRVRLVAVNDRELALDDGSWSLSDGHRSAEPTIEVSREADSSLLDADWEGVTAGLAQRLLVLFQLDGLSLETIRERVERFRDRRLNA